MRDWVEVTPTLRATGDGAVWLPDHATIVIADLHIGYARAARRRGGYLPGAETSEHVAERVRALATRTDARRVIIAGDLRHSTRDIDAGERDDIDRFLSLVREQVTVDVVAGNHDRGDTAAHTSIAVGNVVVQHLPPAATPAVWTICGHLHPSTTLRDETGASARYPCFLVGENTVILPAFTEWAGGTHISRLVPELPPGDWRRLVVHNGLIFDL